MKQNNSAKKYLDKVSGSALYFKDGKFPNMPLYQEKDIEAAFNAGCESMLENMPELEWREKICRDEYFLEAYALGAYYLIRLGSPEFHVVCNYKHFKSCISLSEAKQAANEHYKKQIKQALGL